MVANVQSVLGELLELYQLASEDDLQALFERFRREQVPQRLRMRRRIADHYITSSRPHLGR